MFLKIKQVLTGKKKNVFPFGLPFCSAWNTDKMARVNSHHVIMRQPGWGGRDESHSAQDGDRVRQQVS